MKQNYQIKKIKFTKKRKRRKINFWHTKLKFSFGKINIFGWKIFYKDYQRCKKYSVKWSHEQSSKLISSETGVSLYSIPREYKK